MTVRPYGVTVKDLGNMLGTSGGAGDTIRYDVLSITTQNQFKKNTACFMSHSDAHPPKSPFNHLSVDICHQRALVVIVTRQRGGRGWGQPARNAACSRIPY
jgi:hypothetical protein